MGGDGFEVLLPNLGLEVEDAEILSGTPWRDKIELNCTDIWLGTVDSVARGAKEVRIAVV